MNLSDVYEIKDIEDAMKGENIMVAFDNSEFEKYKEETREKWGKTSAYKEHEERTKKYSKQKWNELIKEMDDIFAEFALCMKEGEGYDSSKVQNLVKMLQNHITDNYYYCTNEILAGLGKMYVADERFKKNIDKHADGTAAYTCKSIEIYCSK